MAPFRLRPRKKPAAPAPAKVPNRPQAAAMPKQVAPSSASTTTRAESRRGISRDTRAEIIRTARPLAVGGAAAGGALAIGWGGREVLSAATAHREAGFPKVGQGVATDPRTGKETNLFFVRNPDGTFSTYGIEPSHTKDPPPPWMEQFGETAKTVGLVLGGLLIVGGVVYVATNPRAAGALRKAVGR